MCSLIILDCYKMSTLTNGYCQHKMMVRSPNFYILSNLSVYDMRVFWVELKRAFLSPYFLVASTGTVIACLLGGAGAAAAVTGFGSTVFGEISVQAAYAAMYSDAFLMVIPILCTLPYTTSFMEDAQNGYIRAYLPRSGRKHYLLSKTAATALSGGGALFTGIVALLVIYSILFPPAGIESSGDMNQVYSFTYSAYFLGAFLILMGGFLWALTGGIAACALNNRYMAYALPFIAYYILFSFQARYFSSVFVMNPRQWLRPEQIGIETAFAYLLILGTTAGAAYYFLMKRRLKDV